MRQLGLVFFLAFMSQIAAYSQSPQQLGHAWDHEHISKIQPSDVRHVDLKKYLEVLKQLQVDVKQVGWSNASREIYQIEWGHGPLKVFLWSQMHGDEPTATSALIDMFAYFKKNQNTPWIKNISEKITIRAVPMLNPDGAEIYQRRNLQGIDINRDALDLKTPEARLLKQLRDEWNPNIGFNLHNQQALTTVGRAPSQASISFLAVYGDEAKTTNYGYERNVRLISKMIQALQNFIPGHIARYEDEWTPTAFGDNFSGWGTPVILIETGALHGKDELYLAKMNFIALITALESLATGSEATQPPGPYLSLAENGSGGLVNFLFRRANIVNVTKHVSGADGTPMPPTVVVSVGDIAAVTKRRRQSFLAPSNISRIGDLASLRGLVEYDASGFYVRQRNGNMKVGDLAEFYFYRKSRNLNWKSADAERFQPDAVFSGGKWISGEGVVPKN